MQALPTGCRETAVPAHLFSTCELTTRLSAAFLMRYKQPPLLWADLSLYSTLFTECEHPTSEEYWEDLSYLYQPQKQFKTTVGNEGRGRDGRWTSLYWLLLSKPANFCLYSGPTVWEQKQRRALSPGINTEGGSYGNREAELSVRKVFNQAHTSFLWTHWPHSIR